MWCFFLTQKTSQKQATNLFHCWYHFTWSLPKPCPLTYGSLEVAYFQGDFADSWMCFTERPSLVFIQCQQLVTGDLNRKTTCTRKWCCYSCLWQRRKKGEVCGQALASLFTLTPDRGSQKANLLTVPRVIPVRLQCTSTSHPVVTYLPCIVTSKAAQQLLPVQFRSVCNCNLPRPRLVY